MRTVDPALKEWATETQARYVDAVIENGGFRAAAKALGVDHSSIVGSIRAAEKKAALHGWSPNHDMRKTVPDGYIVKGVSTYYDEEGKPRGQWVKSALDQNRAEEIARAAVAVLIEDVRGMGPTSPAPVATSDCCSSLVSSRAFFSVRSQAWSPTDSAARKS